MAHSDRQKAEALAVLDACGGNVSEASRQTGLPRATITDWAAGRKINDDVTETRHEIRQDLSVRLEEIAHGFIDRLVQITPTAENIQPLMTGLGIAIDKMQLLKGEPTGINESRSVERTDRDRAGKVLQLIKSAGEKTA